MKARNMKLTGAILLMLLVFVVIGMVPDNVRGGGSGDYPPPASGDWTITTDTVVWNETIILKGNLTVEYGATLTFKNVTLIVDSPVGGTTMDDFYHIEVKRGATMNILDWDNDNTTSYDASNITINNTAAYYWFWVRDGSNFTMKNSELHHCGGASVSLGGAGIMIYTDNATIDHNLISNNYMGVVLYGSDATVSNNTITWNDDTGIMATTWSNATIENNWITWSHDYGIWIDGWDNTNGPWPSNPLVIGNVITDTGRGKDTAVGIQITYNCKPIIKNTKILRSTEDGVYSYHSTPTLINVTIDHARYGISTSSTRYIYIYNTTITNTSLYDMSIVGNPGTYMVATNSFFNESKITIDQYSNLTVRWYLHVYVEDSNHQAIPAAEVRVKDNANGTYDKNFTTDGNGYIKWIVLTEYWANKTTKISYTPYNITVNYTGLTFIDNPRDTDMNTSKTEVFRATTPVPEFRGILIPVLFTAVLGALSMRKRRLK